MVKMDERVQKAIEDLNEAMKANNEEIQRLAERVGDKERKKIAERGSIDSDIAESIRLIVSNTEYMGRLVNTVNFRLERLAVEGAHYPYI